ncbi:helix-turn-helix domain-containing protein [Flavobacterium lacus]|nr:helix-turn-helix domain-containing protein [Flavobacterium lacus]
MWTFLYLKVIYSPEFLYGYDMFQNKIKEYNKHKIIFDNIWSTKTIIPVTNLQDKRLKEIIEGEIDNYILCIEKLALNKDLYFSESFKIQDLSFKLDIPKSHITYVFKYHSKISFNDFKKIIRIKKVIHLIDDGYLKNNTFDALANETGFASYSAFFKTFKNSMGISPKEYYVIRQQKLQ